MDRKEMLQKIAMTVLSQGNENKRLQDDLEQVKKAHSVDVFLGDMIERGIISEEVKASKREELLAKTAEEMNAYKKALEDISSSASANGMGEVDKEAHTSSAGDKFDQWVMS